MSSASKMDRFSVFSVTEVMGSKSHLNTEKKSEKDYI